MFLLRTTLAVVVSTAAVISVAAAAKPRTTWRPATEADLQRIVVPAPAVVPAVPPPVTDWASEQRVYIDPATNEIVSSPVFAPEPEVPGLQRPMPDMNLRRTPEGFLYIDTSGYQNVETATIGADGSVHVVCNVPGHRHGSDDAAAEPTP